MRRSAELAAGLAAEAILDRRPAPKLADLLTPAELEALRDSFRAMAERRNTFGAFLQDALLSLPQDARSNGAFVLAVARFARDVWHR